MNLYSTLPSPIGELLLVTEGERLSGVYMQSERHAAPFESARQRDWVRDDRALRAAREQLQSYFAGERTGFDLPLAAQGTAFQQRVWKALCEIPFGETISYGELARRIGQPNASRAVGLANGQNPISIIVPCHRVIGANGSLTGYGGGIERKRWLLAHEAARRQARLI